MKRYIIDTSVLVAGLLTRRQDSPTVHWLHILLEGTEPVIVSQALLTEYHRVLMQKLHMAATDVDDILAAILSHALILDPPPAPDAPPDPGDSHLWALLAADPTAGLVTGDTALIEGRDDQRALNPREARTRWLSSPPHSQSPR